MITSPLLDAKYKVQKQLGEDARHDILEYAKTSHRIVAEVEKMYKIKFKYDSQGDFTDRGNDSVGA